MKQTKGSVWLAGPPFTKHNTGINEVEWPENQPLFRELNRNYRVRKSADGWFVDGGRGQLWEYGIGKVGFTVGTGNAISAAIEAGFTPTQRGDGEANFGGIAWNDENLTRINLLLRLKKRRTFGASTKPSIYSPPRDDSPAQAKKAQAILAHDYERADDLEENRL